MCCRKKVELTRALGGHGADAAALFAAAGVSVHDGGGGGALTELALFACPECVDALCV